MTEEQSRNNRAALGQDPGSASRDTQNSMFELFFRIKISNKWKMLTTGEAVTSKEGKRIRRPSEARLKGCRPCTHPDPYQQTWPWAAATKLLNNPPGLGHMTFEGTSPPCRPLPGKAIRLFFSTSHQTLSLRFDSALVHRDKFSASEILGSLKLNAARAWEIT